MLVSWVAPVRLPSGPAQARDVAARHRIGAGREHDRNGGGCAFRGKNGRFTAGRNQHRYRTTHQLGSKCRQALVSALGPAVFNRDVSSLDEASLLQTLAKGS